MRSGMARPSRATHLSMASGAMRSAAADVNDARTVEGLPAATCGA